MGAGFRIKAKANSAAEIFIYEDVGESWFGGVTAKQFAEDLKSLGNVTSIDLRINSAGGDVFDGRGFLKSAISGRDSDPKSKTRTTDFDVDLKLGAVAGFNGEALRSVDAKISRRNGFFKAFTLSGKVGPTRLLRSICAAVSRAAR